VNDGTLNPHNRHMIAPNKTGTSGKKEMHQIMGPPKEGGRAMLNVESGSSSCSRNREYRVQNREAVRDNGRTVK